MKQQDKVFMVVGGLAVLVTAGITGLYLFNNDGDEAITTATSTPSSSTSQDATASSTSSTAATTTDTTSTSTTTSTSSSYKDGSYTAKTTYYVPHGTNTISATITVASGKVTAVKVNNDYTDNESGMYIDSFENSIQSAVVGKSIDGLSLSRVGGASLTTEAFDQVLATIQNEAKA